MKKSKKDKKKKGFSQLGNLFDQYQVKEDKGYVTREFQNYGLYLANKLDDQPHKGLYIKMAKEVSRGILEAALRFVIDSNADSKARLFMWKVKQIKQEKQEKKG